MHNAPRPNSPVSSTIRKTIQAVKANTVQSTTHNATVTPTGTVLTPKQSLVSKDSMWRGDINYSSSYQIDQMVNVPEEKLWPEFGFTSSVGVYVARATVPGLFDWSGMSAANIAWLDGFNVRNDEVCYAPFDGQEEYTLPSGSGGPQFRYWDKLTESSGDTIVVRVCDDTDPSGFKCYRIRGEVVTCE